MLELELEADPPLPAQARLLLGFPHPWYALRSAGSGDGFPPEPVDPATVTAPESARVRVWHADQGHWFLLVSPLTGGSVALQVPGIRVPNAPWRRFGPVALLDVAGDGGYRRVCEHVLTDVEPGAPTDLVVVAPSVASPGERVALGLSRRDRFGNPTPPGPPRVDVRWLPLDGGPPLEVGVLEGRSSGVVGAGRVEVPAPGEGAWVAEVRPVDPEEAPRRFRSNPVRVRAGATRVAWGDIHGHSGLGDGWGSPTSHYRHARHAAFLDVASVSEHDWQLEPLEASGLRSETEEAHEPGRFVTLPAMEINLSGHEVAYFFDGPRLDALAPAAAGGATEIWEEIVLDRPAARLEPPVRDLLERYGEDDLLVVTHSSLAPSMGTTLPPTDPLPAWQAIEIYSVHGNNECRDCPRTSWSAGDPEAPVGSVRQALDGGAILGFVAAGDSHDGRPGSSLWGGHPGGLTAFVVTELTRAGVRDALKQRRTWATTGERMLLDLEVGGQGAGSVLTPEQVGPIRFRVLAGEPVDGVDLVCDGEVAWSGPHGGPDVWTSIDGVSPRSWCYLRVRLEGGGMGWTSPIFVRPTSPELR